MTQLGFKFNANECSGCKACVVACKDVNNLPVGFKLRHVISGESGSWQADPATGIPVPQGVFSYSVSYACMHCSSPACVEKCPTGAMGKDEQSGIVSVNAPACIGCGSCAKACPWDAPVVIPAIDGTRKTRKCDFCQELMAQGEEPACVAACLMRCLSFGPVEPGAIEPNAPWCDPLVPDAPETSPNLEFTPHRALAANPQAAVRVHSMPEEYENV